MFGPATATEVEAARVLTGAAMALFIAVGLVPGLRPYATPVRAGILAAYLLGCAGFVVYVLLLRG